MGSLRDAAARFEELGVAVYGCSLDDVESQAKFALEQALPYPLLSDPDGSVARKYGVHAGRYAKRATFVIDAQGILRHAETEVQVDTHGADMVALIQRLKGSDR